ncbi:MAG TPA: hypothetical protein VGK99_20665, partial [Acidobacteriota bacterium]
MTEAHYNIILRHFRNSLEEISIEKEKIEKVMALLESTRDVVLGHSRPAPMPDTTASTDETV